MRSRQPNTPAGTVRQGPLGRHWAACVAKNRGHGQSISWTPPSGIVLADPSHLVFDPRGHEPTLRGEAGGAPALPRTGSPRPGVLRGGVGNEVPAQAGSAAWGVVESCPWGGRQSRNRRCQTRRLGERGWVADPPVGWRMAGRGRADRNRNPDKTRDRSGHIGRPGSPAVHPAGHCVRP